MAQRRQFHQKKRKQSPRSTSQPSTTREAPVPFVRPAPVVYGKPFIVLEDADKNTFFFKAGAWIPYSASIAECRRTCKVKELAQRVNQMIRYEVRCPQEEQS